MSKSSTVRTLRRVERELVQAQLALPPCHVSAPILWEAQLRVLRLITRLKKEV
jgi:hypothetical protein